jgi:hypothetical protein
MNEKNYIQNIINEFISTQPIYEPEEYFVLQFYEFYLSISSLKRYYEFNENNIGLHLKKIEEDRKNLESIEEDILFDDTIGLDLDSFHEILGISVIAFALNHLENLMTGIIQEISKEKNIKIELEKSSNPKALKLLLLLKNEIGLNIELDTDHLQSLNEVVDIKNRYFSNGKIEINYPHEKATSSDPNLNLNDLSYDYKLVSTILLNIGFIAKDIELAYIQFYKSKE